MPNALKFQVLSPIPTNIKRDRTETEAGAQRDSRRTRKASGSKAAEFSSVRGGVSAEIALGHAAGYTSANTANTPTRGPKRRAHIHAEARPSAGFSNRADENRKMAPLRQTDSAFVAAPRAVPSATAASSSKTVLIGVKRKKSDLAAAEARPSSHSSRQNVSSSSKNASGSSRKHLTSNEQSDRPVARKKSGDVKRSVKLDGASQGSFVNGQRKTSRSSHNIRRVVRSDDEGESDKEGQDDEDEDEDEEQRGELDADSAYSPEHSLADTSPTAHRLLNTAPTWQLQRIKKVELIRLHVILGTFSDEDAEETATYTKQELIDAVISARDITSRHTSPAASIASSTSDAEIEMDDPADDTYIDLDEASPEATPPSAASKNRAHKINGTSSVPRRKSSERAASYSLRQRTQQTSRQGKHSEEVDEEREDGQSSDYTTEESESDGDDEDAGHAESSSGPRRSRTRTVTAGKGSAEISVDAATAPSETSTSRQRVTRASKAAASLLANRRAGRRSSTLGAFSPSPRRAGRPSIPRRLRGNNHQNGHGASFVAASSPLRAHRDRANGGRSAHPLRKSFGGGWTSAEKSHREGKPPRGKSYQEIIDLTSDSNEEEDAEDAWGSADEMQNATQQDDDESDDGPQPRRGSRARGQRALGLSRPGASSTRKGSRGQDYTEDDVLGSSDDGGDERSSAPGGWHEEEEEEDIPRRMTRSISRSLSVQSLASDARSALTQLDESGDQHDDDIEDDDDDDAGSDLTPESPSKIRRLRNGKLRLQRKSLSRMSSEEAKSDSAADDTFRPDDSLDGSDVDMQDASRMSYAEEEEDEEEAADDTIVDDIMIDPTTTSLSRLRKAELLSLCTERGLNVSDELKKADLVQALLNSVSTMIVTGGRPLLNARFSQVDARQPASSGRSDATSIAKVSSTSSLSSAPPPSSGKQTKKSRSKTATPLLLRSKSKEIQDTQPDTPPLTTGNADAHPAEAVDELNGLDLESLNLVDKEIAPSKLEKLDKIGSGGFKDVYVGKYKVSKSRSMKVAIADIRDQLTEMDIKELSLLRDLKHENIVRFIGVSIPDDPRIVPCMIVSELCSNGDLFDYIRNVSAPSDAEIVS